MQFERITFHFEGDLADRHQLNFYESARFQYAAARFVTKLANFQAAGRFPKKITNQSNYDIVLESQSEGSFDISILAPILPAVADIFITTPISSLMSYVFERLFSKSEDDAVIAALNAQTKVVETFGKVNADNTETLNKALDMLKEQAQENRDLHLKREEYLEQRLAERDREILMLAEAKELSKIDDVKGQKLLAMGAPLVTEMATALRKSADSLDIISESDKYGQHNIAYMNDRIAKEIEVSKIDEEPTPIRVNIVQYNKETGWGKVRMAGIESLVPFNVPNDLKSQLQSILLIEMTKVMTFVQAFFVRDRAGAPTRLILVTVIPEISEKL